MRVFGFNVLGIRVLGIRVLGFRVLEFRVQGVISNFQSTVVVIVVLFVGQASP